MAGTLSKTRLFQSCRVQCIRSVSLISSIKEALGCPGRHSSPRAKIYTSRSTQGHHFLPNSSWLDKSRLSPSKTRAFHTLIEGSFPVFRSGRKRKLLLVPAKYIRTNMGFRHTFATSSLTRLHEEELKDASFVSRMLAREDTKFCILHDGKVLMELCDGTEGESLARKLKWVSRSFLTDLNVVLEEEQSEPNDHSASASVILLGKETVHPSSTAAGSSSNRASQHNQSPEETTVFENSESHRDSSDTDGGPHKFRYAAAVDLSGAVSSEDLHRRSNQRVASMLEDQSKTAPGWTQGGLSSKLCGMRGLLMQAYKDKIPDEQLVNDFAVIAQAKGFLDWHRQHRFCGVCGSKSTSKSGGTRRECTNESCGTRQFVRTDPVVIMVVISSEGDKLLLGRSLGHPKGMYSALAGFMEPAESIEDAVKREVMEEAGISVGEVRYHSSQPWPIGRGAATQLMIGCLGRATSDSIQFNQDEMDDVRWFTREEALGLLKDPFSKSTGGLGAPPRFAIAHHLIRAACEVAGQRDSGADALQSKLHSEL